jgi:hypothetical protein
MVTFYALLSSLPWGATEQLLWEGGGVFVRHHGCGCESLLGCGWKQKTNVLAAIEPMYQLLWSTRSAVFY